MFNFSVVFKYYLKFFIPFLSAQMAGAGVDLPIAGLLVRSNGVSTDYCSASVATSRYWSHPQVLTARSCFESLWSTPEENSMQRELDSSSSVAGLTQIQTQAATFTTSEGYNSKLYNLTISTAQDLRPDRLQVLKVAEHLPQIGESTFVHGFVSFYDPLVFANHAKRTKHNCIYAGPIVHKKKELYTVQHVLKCQVYKPIVSALLGAPVTDSSGKTIGVLSEVVDTNRYIRGNQSETLMIFSEVTENILKYNTESAYPSITKQFKQPIHILTNIQLCDRMNDRVSKIEMVPLAETIFVEDNQVKNMKFLEAPKNCQKVDSLIPYK